MQVPVGPGVGVQEAEVVHELVGHDAHRVLVPRVEAGEDPQLGGHAGEQARAHRRVGAVKVALAAARALPAWRHTRIGFLFKS